MKTLLLAMMITLPSDVEQLKNKAVEAFNKAEATVLVKPNTPDVVEKCPCNGTGVVTHGDGHKTPCAGTSAGPCKFRKGDAAVKPKTILEVQPKNSNPVQTVKKDHGLILMESLPGCLACRQAEKSQLLKDLLKTGWRFKVIEPNPGTTSVPRFTAIMNGEPILMQSFSSQEINRVNQIFQNRVK